MRIVSNPAQSCSRGVLQVTRFVVRHKRRRLGIEAVDIDPDAEARLDAAAGFSGSAAAMLCGGPPKADKPFDF